MDGNEANVGTIDIGESEKPRSIAVHSIKRLLFWTDVGSQQAIYRSRIDGAERILLAHHLDGITAITVDPLLDLIFFAMEKSIDYMDINGKNRFV